MSLVKMLNSVVYLDALMALWKNMVKTVFSTLHFVSRVSPVSVLEVPWLELAQLLKFNLLIISFLHSIRLSMKPLNTDIEVVPSSIVAV